MTTPLADLLRSMAADGCSIETLIKAVEVAEMKSLKRLEPSPGALRQRRWRERLEASQTVTSDAETSRETVCSLSKDLDLDLDIKKGRASQRGKRLALDWLPSPATCDAMRLDCGVEGDAMEATLKRFRDYWTAIPGQKGCKLDWDATLRNWIRKDCEKNTPAAVSWDERYKRAREAYSSGGPLNGAGR